MQSLNNIVLRKRLAVVLIIWIILGIIQSFFFIYKKMVPYLICGGGAYTAQAAWSHQEEWSQHYKSDSKTLPRMSNFCTCTYHACIFCGCCCFNKKTLLTHSRKKSWKNLLLEKVCNIEFFLFFNAFGVVAFSPWHNSLIGNH